MAGQTGIHGRANLLDDAASWIAARNGDVQRLADGAHGIGQQVWAAANRAGQYLSAARPSDVAALGIQAMRRAATRVEDASDAAAESATGQARTAVANTKKVVEKAVPTVLAGANGAQDAFTFGLGDRAYAGVRAIDDAIHGDDLRRGYARHYAGTQALDRHDEEYHPIARTVGQLSGTGAQIALSGGGEGLVAAGTRIPELSAILLRERGAIAGAGALSGVGGQAISDLQRGHLGSLADYGGAAVGGAVGATASGLTHGNAAFGGSVGGATTSAAQDLFNGRPVSLDRVREAAGAGGLVGGVFGASGRALSNNASNATKAELGEAFSQARTAARGDWTKPVGKSRAYLDDGRYTYPDQRTFRGELVESKFGRSARLRPRQRQAYNQPLPNYRVDHFLPQDVGMVLGLPLGLAASDVVWPNDNS